MGYFLTDRAEMQQSNIDGKWITEHNQLYIDYDCTIYLTPRNYISDGYTIPNWIAWLGGGKMQWDIRPSLQHDIECQYHQGIIVNLSIEELQEKQLLYFDIDEDNKFMRCKDIPQEYLIIKDLTFKQVNDKFKRAMEATQSIKQWRINAMRFAVNLNVGWLSSGKKKLSLEKIYKLNKDA